MMRFLSVLLLAFFFMPAAHAERGVLEGWGDIKFGMTFDQAYRASGGIGQKGPDLFTGTVLYWKTSIIGEQANVRVVFGRKDRVTAIELEFPGQSGVASLGECRAIMLPKYDEIMLALSMKYGEQDAETKGQFTFKNSAYIIATIKSLNRSCSITVNYISSATPSGGGL
jgi:hypothetical protein